MLAEFWDKHGKTILLVSMCMFSIVVAWNTLKKLGSKKGARTVSTATTDTATAGKNYPKSAGEAECQRVLMDIYNTDFNSHRPAFLNNPVTSTEKASYNLELDCYNPALKLAVEYNGRQHYEHVPFFHKNKEAFYNQKYRDELKRIMCNRAGVTLIEVPYTVSVPNIRNYLIKALQNVNLYTPKTK